MQKVPCPTLYEMFETRKAKDLEGNEHKFDQAVHVEYAEALYGFMLKEKPEVVVEVGIACGTTSLAILAGMETNGTGKLVSIDPGQSTYWHNCGVAAVKRAGLEARHTVIEDYNYNALPKVLADMKPVDFVYIDGWHTFDHALLDWFYADKMLKEGGVVAFNDSHFRAVFRVIKFVLSHRHYSEIDVGLPKRYDSRIPVAGPLIKRLSGRSNADRYFRKLDSWEGPSHFYARF